MRIHSFKQQLLTQLKAPKTLTSTLFNGLKLAYQEHQQPTSQPSNTQQTIIGWTHFIRGRILKDLTNTMSNFYRASTQPSQRFSGISWTKAVVIFMLEAHVTEWKYRCELNFKPKSILHNNQYISFHKRPLLITVNHFLSKMESLSLSKQKWCLDSKEEYQLLSVKQLTQWITNTKILFKSNRSYKTNNRKITEYFGRDSARNNNISPNTTLNKTIPGEDSNHNKLYTNSYLAKNKEWYSTIGTNIKNHSNNREEKKINNIDNLTSLLPQPTDTNQTFGNNQTKRNISKKPIRTEQKELLDKTLSQSNKNKIPTQPAILLPSSTKIARTIIKRSQKQINSSTIQNFKKSSYDRNLDSLGNNTTNNIITKNNVNQINTIYPKIHIDIKIQVSSPNGN